MTNKKMKAFNKAIENMEFYEGSNLLSEGLVERVGPLQDRAKITIRLDERIVEAAKAEADEQGVSYHKIINDRLLEIFSIQQMPYLDSSNKTIQDILERLEKLEALHKKRA